MVGHLSDLITQLPDSASFFSLMSLVGDTEKEISFQPEFLQRFVTVKYGPASGALESLIL